MKKCISLLALCALIFNAKINAQEKPIISNNDPVILLKENETSFESRSSNIKFLSIPIKKSTLAPAQEDGVFKLNTDVSLQVQGRAIIGEHTQVAGKDNNFRLSVEGKIVAKEIVVRIDNWADYVFANNYKLMPLKDVKKYLDVNKHLPGIEPAAAVEGNGLNLGEMQKKQMEKTEELYLYVIQLSEQMEQLRAENAVLKKEMQQLKK